MFEHADAIGTDRQTGTSVASAICVIAVVREDRVALETDPRGARDRFGSRRARGGGIDPQLNRERIGDARKRIRGDLDVVIDPVEVHRRQGRWKRHDEGLNRPVVRPVVIGPHQPKVVGHASGKAADRRADWKQDRTRRENLSRRHRVERAAGAVFEPLARFQRAFALEPAVQHCIPECDVRRREGCHGREKDAEVLGRLRRTQRHRPVRRCENRARPAGRDGVGPGWQSKE